MVLTRGNVRNAPNDPRAALAGPPFFSTCFCVRSSIVICGVGAGE